MKIKTKLIGSYTLILIALVFVSIFLKKTLMDSGNNTEELYRAVHISRNSIIAKYEFIKFYNILMECKNAIGKEEYNNVREIIKYKLISPELSIISKTLELKNKVNDKDGKALIIELEALHNEWTTLLTDVDEKLANRDSAGSIAIMNKLVTFMNGYIEKLSQLEEYTDKISDRNYSSSKQQITRAQTISTMVVFFTLITLVLVAFVISKSILKSLSLFNTIFVSGSSGDLNAKYPVHLNANDEINALGAIFNSFIQKLNDVIKEVSEVAENLNTSSDRLFETTSAFSGNTQNQAANSEQITATMEEVTAGVNSISNNAQTQHNKLNEVVILIKNLSDEINVVAQRISDTRGLSKAITEQAKSGSKALNLMTLSMDEIAKSSREVADIVQIIGNISGEINLLSLNAAIEAARAGDSGRGFAVVADEISKLADQTASSISQIASLIEKNNNEIFNGMKNVNDTISGISKIIEGVESIDGMMNTITNDVNKQQQANKSVNASIRDLQSLSEEVKIAAEEQRTAAEEIMKSMNSINQMVQSSASGAEEIVGNVETLSSMADHLRSKISFFKFHR